MIALVIHGSINHRTYDIADTSVVLANIDPSAVPPYISLDVTMQGSTRQQCPPSYLKDFHYNLLMQIPVISSTPSLV